MVEIKAAKHKGGLYALSVRGHAAGSVPVCAAISTVTQALAGYLTRHQTERFDIEELTLRGGEAEIRFRSKDPAAADAVWEMSAGMLQWLARRNPEYIRVL